MDPRTPVLVGQGEVTDRSHNLDPITLLSQAIQSAITDTGAGNLGAAIHTVAICRVFSGAYANPGLAAMQKLGFEPLRCIHTTPGGNSPGMLLGQICREIQQGALDAAVIGGVEALATQRKLKKSGQPPTWTHDLPAAQLVGDERAGTTAAESAAGLIMPINMYPLLENALRGRLKRSRAQHLDVVARLWSGFSAVAANNPLAWNPQFYSPDEIASPSANNRRVSDPYPKLLNSIMAVNQAAAVIVMSYEKARGLGIARDRMTFVSSVADCSDEWFVTHRQRLDESPAIRVAVQAALSTSGKGIDDVEAFDLYSCFPIAVELAAEAMGLNLDDSRGLTLTGGLTFFGGAGNNYSTHGIAAAMRLAREAQSQCTVMATCLGMYATKHSVVLLSNRPESNFEYHNALATGAPARATGQLDAVATLETFNITYDHSGQPIHAVVFALAADQTRAMISTEDPELIAWLEETDPLGVTVRINTVKASIKLS